MNFAKGLGMVAAAALLISGCAPKTAEEPHGFSPPIPPQQGLAWVAPATGLPAEVVGECADVFDTGMADPRGCEYREITLEVRERADWRAVSHTIRTEGWVLPSRPDDARRFAVCWNGLVYPVVTVGERADAATQIRALLAEPNSWSADPMRPVRDEGLAADKLTTLKVPLLLRLGEGELAFEVWSKWKAFPGATRYGDPPAPANFFVVVNRQWLWAKFDRAREAHLKNDPNAAVADLQDIPSERARVEQLAAKRGVKVETVNWPFQRADDLLDLSFLDQAPALLADDRRRVAENVANRGEEFAPEKIPDKKQRIGLLIRDLEDVEAYPMMSPGYIQFEMSPVVDALVREGEDAVDPLIDCVEKDTRLTRTIDDGGGRHFEAYGYSRVVGVEEPAFAALQAILRTQSGFPWLKEPYVNGTPGLGEHLERRALAVRIRAYWNKVRGQSLAQRWYATLEDDNATPEQWAEAADAIVAPKSDYSMGMRIYNSNEPLVMQGEELRSGLTPSVSDLMAKRLREADERQKNDPSPFPSEPPRKLAEDLAKWDDTGQLETLARHCGVLKQKIASQGENAGSGPIAEFVKTILARKEGGDPQALADYAAWLRSANANLVYALSKMYGAFYLPPVWSYPDDPAIASLIRWLTADPKSLWRNGQGRLEPEWVMDAVHSPMEAIPAYRALVLQQLRDTTVVGNVEVTPENIMVTVNYGSGSVNDDPDAVVGTKQEVRRCDYLAARISEFQGAPRFETYWPVERRDRAIKDVAAFLQRFGNAFAYRTSSQGDDANYPYPFTNQLRFPVLDHPATQAEAAAGRAIFLGGERRAAGLEAASLPVSGELDDAKGPARGATGCASRWHDDGGDSVSAGGADLAGGRPMGGRQMGALLWLRGLRARGGGSRRPNPIRAGGWV